MAERVEPASLQQAFRSGRMAARARALTFQSRAEERLEDKELPFADIAYLQGVRDAASALSTDRSHTPARLLAVLFPGGMER